MISKGLRTLVSVVLCTLCVLAGITLCGAVSETYTINNIDGMSVTLPDGMTAVTRSSKSSDKYFSLFGLDYKTTMENFKSGDIYLQGMNDTSTLTVTVTMTKNEDSESIKSYNLLERDKLTEVMGNFLKQTEYSSCTPDEKSDKQLVWLMFDTQVSTETETIKAYQAHTVYDGMSINVTLQRNGSNVTNDDYSVFSGIVSSISFDRVFFGGGIATVIIIAAALIIIIFLLIFIIRLKYKQRRRSKANDMAESRNEKILMELADEYNLTEKSQSDSLYKQDEKGVNKDYTEDYFEDFVDVGMPKERNYESSYIRDEEYQQHLENDIRGSYFTENDDTGKVSVKDKNSERYATDEEIDEILSGAHSMDESVAREVYRNKKPENSSKISASPFFDDAVRNETDFQSGTDNSSEIYEENIHTEVFGGEDLENTDLTEDGLTELDEFNNDEVLVREVSKQSKFENSYDFFEEAPKKKMGMISNKDIDEAEDYDVISEIEQRASKVSREESKEPSFGEKALAGLIAFGRGVKSFGVHCGYFCTNVYRLIKRKRMLAKRKKAEQERIERARARAERQRQLKRASEDGSLVQVHSRTERRPVPRGTQNRRKPSFSQSNNKR